MKGRKSDGAREQAASRGKEDMNTMNKQPCEFSPAVFPDAESNGEQVAFGVLLKVQLILKFQSFQESILVQILSLLEIPGKITAECIDIPAVLAPCVRNT